jgi:DNA-binding transcriptional LysR family regulator
VRLTLSEQQLKAFLKHEAEFLSQEKEYKAIRIGTFEIFSTYLLPRVWTKYFPAQGLELQELLPGRIEEAVEEGAVDVGITVDPIPRTGIEFLKITTSKSCVCVRRGSFRKTP